jgi:GTP pyrophosphokinase
MGFTAEIGNVQQLKRTLSMIHDVPGVVGARRA